MVKVPVPKPALSPIANVPADTVDPPEYVFVPDSVKIPVPDFVTEPVPDITPEIVVLLVPFTVSVYPPLVRVPLNDKLPVLVDDIVVLADNTTGKETVEDPVLINAPEVDDTPLPARFKLDQVLIVCALISNAPPDST